MTLHLQRYGSVCPGWGVPAHTATKAELTGDHKIPLSLGGKSIASNIEVMCRRCNSRKGGRSTAPTGHQMVPPAAPVPPPTEKPKKAFRIYQYPDFRE